MVKSSKKKSKNVDGSDLCDPKFIKIKKRRHSAGISFVAVWMTRIPERWI